MRTFAELPVVPTRYSRTNPTKSEVKMHIQFRSTSAGCLVGIGEIAHEGRLGTHVRPRQSTATRFVSSSWVRIEFVMISGAVIYCRVSSDQSGRARSVAEQESDCRRTCEVEGWPVVDVVIDNDIGASQYSQGTRPGFLRLRTLLTKGIVLVSWESSRITRKLSEFAELRDFCSDLGVQWYVGGRLYDLHEPQDVYMLGIAAQNAELEVALTRKRIMRAKDENSARGVHNGRMPFGYHKVDGVWAINPVAAQIVQEAVRRLLAGESPRAIAHDFTARNLPSPSKSVKHPGWADGKGLRMMVTTPTYAAIHVRNQLDKSTGKMVEVSRTQGDWEPIISVGEHIRLVSLLSDPTRKTSGGNQPKHLLSGIATCVRCRKPVYWVLTAPTQAPRYRCKIGCVQRNATLVDKYVEDSIIELFSDKVWSTAALYGDDTGAKEAAVQVRELRQQLEAEILALSRANISPSTRAHMAELLEADLMPKIEAAEQTSLRVGNPVMQKFAESHDARGVWKSLDILDQREVVRECLIVTILRVENRNNRVPFDPESVTVAVKNYPDVSNEHWRTHIEPE